MTIRQIKQKKYVWKIVVVSTIFACFLLFLPTLLSMAPFNRIVFNTLNRQVTPANLTIDDISLGWFSHQRAKHVRYTDKNAGIEADLTGLTIEKNLFQLLFHRTGLGSVRLESPRVMIPLKKVDDIEADDSEESDRVKESSDDDKRLTDQTKPLSQKLLAWGSISFKDGQIFGVTNSGEEVLLLDQVLFQTQISKETSQAIAKLSAKSGSDAGTVAGEVAITLPENGAIDKTSVVGQGGLIVTNWNLEEVLPLLALFYEQIPNGSGRLNGKWRVENPAGKELKLSGDFKAKNVVLYGGLLKKDKPKIAQIEGAINAFRREGQWSLKKLQFKSPLASGTASGFQKNRVAIDTRINVAPALRELPNTLNIRDDLKITNGSIKISGKTAFSDTGTHFDGRVTLSRIEGQQNKRKFAWKKPLTIKGKGRYEADRWLLEQAQIASSFVNGDLNATPDRFESRLTIDAAKTFKQAGQFFKLPPIVLKGLLRADVIAQKNGKVWDLNIDTASEALGIHSAKKTLLAAAPFKLVGKSQYHVENMHHLLTAPRLAIDSGLLEGDYTADQLELLPGGRMLRIDNMAGTGEADIEKIKAVYTTAAELESNLTISGRTRYEVAFDFKQDQINLHNISLQTTLFNLGNSRQYFADPKMLLSGSGIIDIGKRSISFAPVNISTTAGAVTLESFKLGNLRNPFEDMTAKGIVKFDLAKLTPLVGSAPLQPNTLAGNGEAMLEWVWRNGSLKTLSAKGIMAPFKWYFSEKTKIDEPKVVMDLEMKPGRNNTSAINRLLVKSNLISLNGTGSVYPRAQKTWLRLNGNVDPNLEKLSRLLSTVADQKVILSGKKETPFALKVARKNDSHKSWFQRLSFEAQFPASRMTMMGVVLEQIAMPGSVQNGRIRFDLEAAVNNGTMRLAPSVDLIQEPNLKVGKGVVLNNVRITQSMIDQFLVRLHPIFIGATASQGTVGLKLEKLEWPLTDNTEVQMTCDGQLTFNQVALKSSGLLDSILSLLKADRRNIAIINEAVTFSCSEGRVVTSPLTLKADDTTIVLEGSMGRDQTLSFVAKTPVTNKMVSEKIFPYVADSMLTIPIEGSAANPQINTDQFYAELEDLLKEAGGRAIKKDAEDFIKEKTEGLLKQIFK